MRDSAFYAVTRHAAPVSRRGSLRLLGGAGLTGVFARSTNADAGRKHKDAGRRYGKHAAQCRAGVERFCSANVPDNPACPESTLPCCEHFARGRADLGVECLSTGEPQPAARA
jgi:hypothetical protein